MTTGKEAWNFLKENPLKMPKGYSIFCRSTKFSEWKKANYHWCIKRNYFYVNGVDTKQISYEVCASIYYSEFNPITAFLHELNVYDFDRIGIEFVDIGDGI